MIGEYRNYSNNYIGTNFSFVIPHKLFIIIQNLDNKQQINNITYINKSNGNNDNANSRK